MAASTVDPDVSVELIKSEWPNDLQYVCQAGRFYFFRSKETRALQRKLGDPQRDLIELKDRTQRHLLRNLSEIGHSF